MPVPRLLIAVLIALAALPAQGALAQGPNRPPTASFNFTPASPAVNERITFTASATDPEGTALTYRWSLDGDGLFNDGTTRQIRRGYASPGTRNVTVEVTDASGGKVTATRAVTVVNRAPVACFGQAPDAPLSGATVTLDSACSADPDGTIASRAWDLDDDGAYDDGTGATASRSWPAPGSYIVRLRVVDKFGGTNTVSHTIGVGNRSPAAGFTVSPSRPVAGSAVTLTSTATDPDGTIATQSWDLDNDGQFDDATGATATWRPATAGALTVGLRVADNSG